eukprot:gene15183-15326_t
MGAGVYNPVHQRAASTAKSFLDTRERLCQIKMARSPEWLDYTVTGIVSMNASVGTPSWAIHMAIIIADDLIYLIPVLLLVLWLCGHEDRRNLAIKACLVAMLGVGMNQVIGLFWQHPRPFMIGLGHAWIPHAADSSFPSDHMTVFVGVGLTLLLDGALWFGLATLIVGLSIAWARLFLGVHFPLDMLGAIGVAACSYIIISPLWQRAGAAITGFAERLYRTVLAQPISAGWKIPAGIWILGFVSMLMDISSEMIHSLLPLFMVTTLGASALAVGLIEGLAESTALIVKIFSGVFSDYLGKRKGLAVLGYAMGALTKPLFAVASTTGIVLAARLLDRTGKGIRGAPRDALVADISPSNLRGAAFGLRQSLDTVGAFLGPLLAVGLMLLWANDFRAVFWVAVIPGLMAVALLLFGLREPEQRQMTKRTNPIRRENLRRLGGAYWWVVGIGAVFTLARFSEAFLVLRAQQSGIPVAMVPLVMVAMNLVYALSAYPFGKLSDQMSHKTLLALGLIVLIAADLVLAASNYWGVILAGVALWGIHMGITQGLLATMVADTAPADLRGTAYGFFNLVSGLAMLLASVLAGLLWDGFGATFTFYAGAIFCVIALAGLAWQPNE